MSGAHEQLIRMLDQAAAGHGELRVADLGGHWRSASWAEVGEAAVVAASLFADLNVDAGSYVILIAEPRVEVIVGLQALLRRGACFTVRSAEARSVEQLIRSLPTGTDPVLAIAPTEFVNTVGSSLNCDVRSWDWLADSLRHDDAAGVELTALLESVPDTRPCILQLTSGSTGDPRSIEVSYRNLAANVQGIVNAAQLSEDDHFATWLPLFHDMGLIGLS